MSCIWNGGAGVAKNLLQEGIVKNTNKLRQVNKSNVILGD